MYVLYIYIYLCTHTQILILFVWCLVSLAICRASICPFFRPSVCLSESDCAAWKMNSVKRVPRTPLIPHLQELDLIATWSQTSLLLQLIKALLFQSRCFSHAQHPKLRCWRMLIFGIWARCHMCSPAELGPPPCSDSLDGFPKPLWHCRNYHLRYSFFRGCLSKKIFLHLSLQPALEAGSEITASLQIRIWSMNKAGNKVATYPLTSMSECPVCDSKLSHILCGKRFWKVRLSKYPVSCPVVCTEPVCRLGELSCVACLEDREKYREPSEAYDAW